MSNLIKRKLEKKDTSVPLYQQLKNLLLEDMQEMEPFSPIPSERELCENYGVSRPTVRRTLELLDEEGEIIRMPGKGAFVAEKSNNKYIDHELDTFIGFYEDVEMQKRKGHSKVIQQSVIESSLIISKNLKIPNNSEVFVLERLRYVDNEPVCLVSSYIPFQICPELLKYDFTNASLYRILQDYEISIYRAQRSIEVKQASIEESKHLGIKKGEPIILFESIGYLDNGTPFEYIRSRYPAYKVKFATEVFKPGKTDFL